MKPIYATLLFFFFTSQCFSQVLSNNGAVVNITSGIILIGGGLNNASGTITNTGTIILT
ncbi:MAG: hypothetical protein JWN83_1145, partial [Chitinophagaceae bacterium]|nr:hypothetical protein [Chitinophagaceae bacterium]